MDSLNRVCMLVLLFTFLNSSCAASTEDDEKKRYQAVTAYWAWGNYWDTGENGAIAGERGHRRPRGHRRVSTDPSVTRSK